MNSARCSRSRSSRKIIVDYVRWVSVAVKAAASPPDRRRLHRLLSSPSRALREQIRLRQAAEFHWNRVPDQPLWGGISQIDFSRPVSLGENRMSDYVVVEEKDWSDVDVEMARQILHQGETFLKAQLDVALASDRRAITAASIFITFATAILGAALANFVARGSASLLVAGIAASAFMFFGAFFAFNAARPVTFYFPGNHPMEWWSCRKAALQEALGGEAENYQTRIESNERVLAENAERLGFAMRFAVCAPVVALIIWGITFYLAP
jgi:hypothetical protein